MDNLSFTSLPVMPQGMCTGHSQGHWIESNPVLSLDHLPSAEIARIISRGFGIDTRVHPGGCMFTVRIENVIADDQAPDLYPVTLGIARYLLSKNYSHIRFSSEGYKFPDLSVYNDNEAIRFVPPPPGVPIGDPSEAQAI